MIWILVTVLVCLVVILAQLLLAYQKRAARLRIAQNPVRKQIDSHKAKLVEVGEEVRTMVSACLEQLQRDMEEYQRRSGRAANLTAELDDEAQTWAAVHAKEQGPQDEPSSSGELEDDGDDGFNHDADELIGGRHEPHMKVDTGRTNPVDLVRAIRHDLEETYVYIENLRTDASIVQQTVERLGPLEKQRGGKGG